MSKEHDEQEIEKAEKLETLNRLLEEDHVLVHLNSKVDEVVLPTHLLGNEMVTLKLSRLFRGHLQVSTDEVVSDLLFNGSYFRCHVPFHAIWGVTSASGANALWPSSAPKEVLQRILEAQAAAVEQEASTSKKSPKPKRASAGAKMKEITGGGTAKEPLSRKGHLRRVK